MTLPPTYNPGIDRPGVLTAEAFFCFIYRKRPKVTYLHGDRLKSYVGLQLVLTVESGDCGHFQLHGTQRWISLHLGILGSMYHFYTKHVRRWQFRPVTDERVD